MSKKIIIAICVAILALSVSFSACHKEEEVTTTTEIAKRYDTLEEIERKLDFSIKVPKDIRVEAYQIYRENAIQVIFDGGYIRKEKTNNQDATYSTETETQAENKSESTTETLALGENQVTFTLTDDAVSKATWTSGDYSYTLGFLFGENKDVAIQYIDEIE